MFWFLPPRRVFPLIISATSSLRPPPPPSNVTMTIEKGSTVIADHYDDAADTVALVVMPGGKIFVEGTEEG